MEGVQEGDIFGQGKQRNYQIGYSYMVALFDLSNLKVLHYISSPVASDWLSLSFVFLLYRYL
jgi:hypothetical protein